MGNNGAKEMEFDSFDGIDEDDYNGVVLVGIYPMWDVIFTGTEPIESVPRISCRIPLLNPT